MSSFTLLLLPIEPFLALSGKHSPGITSVVTPMANSRFAMARPPGQLAGFYIYWNGTPDETHRCLRRSYGPCHHLPLACPQWGWVTLTSLIPALPWLPLWVTLQGQANYCVMSRSRDGGLSTDSSATTVEITSISFAIPRVPPFLLPSLYFVSVDKSLNAAFKKTTVANH